MVTEIWIGTGLQIYISSLLLLNWRGWRVKFGEHSVMSLGIPATQGCFRHGWTSDDSAVLSCTFQSSYFRKWETCEEEKVKLAPPTCLLMDHNIKIRFCVLCRRELWWLPPKCVKQHPNKCHVYTCACECVTYAYERQLVWTGWLTAPRYQSGVLSQDLVMAMPLSHQSPNEQLTGV